MEEEVSQRETASRRRECRQPDHSQAPWVSFRLPHAMGEPSWKPEPSGQEIFFLNTKMNHMWILGLSPSKRKTRRDEKGQEEAMMQTHCP